MTQVYIVGAGPGDPELLTLKGRRVLALADCVLYDNLANPRLLDYAPPTAERIYVGKKRAEHARTQDEICALLVEHARAGRIVVRLKGGDPFLFGRGGEEAEALAEAGLTFEVVPGVTSPLGIAAYTGVPLTHRDHTSVVTFVTGHSVDSIDWSKVGTSETLVVFMGLHHFAEIARELIRNGRSAATPAMAVRWGTKTDQETVTGTIETLPRLVEEAGMLAPTTILIGEVVGLREKLSWFERKPLFGQHVLVTRAREQSEELSHRLAWEGAEPIALPVIEMRAIVKNAPLQAAIDKLDQYQWIVFTSANTVEYFFAALREQGRDARAVCGSICGIGSATAAALDRVGVIADLVPADASSEGVAAAFADVDLQNARVLLPRAAEAREVLPEYFSARGAGLDVVSLYENIIPEAATDHAREVFGGSRKLDWITFTSGSTVKNLLAVAPAGALDGVRLASIGPATTRTMRMHGLEPAAEAAQATMESLVAAIVAAVRK